MKPARFVYLFLLLATSLFAQSNNAPLTNQAAAKSGAARPAATLPMTQHPRRISSQAPATTFAPIVTYGSGGIGAEWVSVADVNADGKLDLIVANGSECSTCTSGGVGVLLGNGDGTFQAAVPYGSGGGWWGNNSDLIAIADVNGDGKPDLVVANFCPDNDLGCYGDDTDGAIGVLLGNGDGTFQTAVPYDSGATGTLSVAVGDVTGDGIPDVVVGNLCAPDTFCESFGSWSVLPGNGDGTFQPALNYAPAQTYDYNSVAIADVNGDGKLDAVMVWECGDLGECSSSGDGGGVGAVLGYINGNFSTGNVDNTGGVFPVSVAVADVNGDGKLDLVVSNQCSSNKNQECSPEGAVGVLLGNGDGTFQPAVVYNSGGAGASSVVVGDLNGDGIPDIAVVNDSGVGVLLGNGNGTFQTAANYGSGGFASVAIADVNGDGKPDLLVANANNTVGVLINTSIGPTTTTLISSLNPSLFSQSVTFTATVMSQGFKNTPTGTVTFFDGTNSLGTTTLSSGGVGILATSTLAVGTQTITATYIGDSNFASSTSAALNQVVQGAVAVLSPTSINFGNQTLGIASTPQRVTLTNTGNVALTITSITVSLSNGSYAQTNTCGTPLAAGASCSATLTWTPGTTGNMTGSLTFTDNAPGSPQTVSLSGIGVVPTVALSPASLTFPTQVVFTTSAAQTVTLTNTGLGNLSITKVSVTGPFAQTNTCGKQVAAGASCTFTVKFTPTTSGTLTGSISITDNASGSPQKITLTGTGTDIQLTPTSLGFGNQPVGTKSLPKKITLSNKASVSVSITSISITGTDKKDFAQTNTCGASVKAGTSCTITVTFTPSADGKQTADVSVDDNGGGSPQIVSLSGTGTGS